MIISEIDLVLKVSAASIGAAEVGGLNRGPYMERVQKRAGDAWCASRVAAVGVSALEERLPMPLSGSDPVASALYDPIVAFMTIDRRKAWMFAPPGFLVDSTFSIVDPSF